jgi:hypothetical protein
VRPDARARSPPRPAVLKRLALIVTAIVVFLVVSGLLARFLSVENDERDADLALVEAEAHGEQGKLLHRLGGCRAHPRCVASVRANLADPRLRRSGPVKILQLESNTAYSLTGATGNTRLAWTVIGTLPVVQCIRVRRTGNFLTGVSITLLSLSAPIPNEGGC